MTCRVCGGVVTGISKIGLEWLGVGELPVWLERLCARCLYEIASRNLPEGDADPIPEVSQQLFLLYLVGFVNEASRRVAQRRSIVRCEAIGGYHHFGDQEDDSTQCPHFSDHQRDGRHVCHWCARRFDKRGKLDYVGTGYRRPKPYLIWATDADDLVAQAREIAAGVSERGAPPTIPACGPASPRWDHDCRSEST